MSPKMKEAAIKRLERDIEQMERHNDGSVQWVEDLQELLMLLDELTFVEVEA